MHQRLKIASFFCAAAMVSTTNLAAENTACDAMLVAAFIEGAPRDNFTFENSSEGAWEVTTINVDLENSAGKLIFDTEAGGNGIEVFQTYKTESGDAAIASVTEPSDGGKTMQLDFQSFATGQTFRFSVDVDDTLERSDLRQIRVTGGELQGTTLRVTFTNSEITDASPLTITGSYDENNKAVIQPIDC